MSGVLLVPFLHTEWLLTAAIGAAAVAAVMPATRARPALAAIGGILLACILAALHLVPWWGQLHLAFYGLFMLLGFLTAYVLLVRRARIIGLSERTVVDLVLVAMVAGLVGARARYVWERPQEFLGTHAHPVAWTTAIAHMVDFDSGGMVWYGGLSLATLAVVLLVWRLRLPILAVADLVAPALLVGLGIGRIGCFVNGCCYGRPTDVPWAVVHDHVLVHPTQLYETIACGLLAGVLWWGWRHRRADGVIACWGVIGYGVWRFLNEGLRGDDRVPSTWWGTPGPGQIDFHHTIALPLDTSQVTSLQLVLAALVLAVAVHAYRRRHPEAWARSHAVPGSRHAVPPATTTTPGPAAAAVVPGGSAAGNLGPPHGAPPTPGV